MSRMAKRAGIEAVWLFGGCAFGAWIWIYVASYYEARVDAYWTTNGHPPQFPDYAAPAYLMTILLIAPYLLIVVIRLSRFGARRMVGRGHSAA